MNEQEQDELLGDLAAIKLAVTTLISIHPDPEFLLAALDMQAMTYSAGAVASTLSDAHRAEFERSLRSLTQSLRPKDQKRS